MLTESQLKVYEDYHDMWVRWKKPLNSAVVLDAEDKGGAENLDITECAYTKYDVHTPNNNE